MNSVTKTISLAVSILVLVAVLSLELYYYNTSFGLAQKNTQGISDVMESILERGLSPGSVVSGEKVRSVIGSGFFTRVVTKECPESFCTFNGVIDSSSKEYIDPSDYFVCTVKIDDNREVPSYFFIEIGMVKKVEAGSIGEYAERLTENKLDVEIERLESDLYSALNPEPFKTENAVTNTNDYDNLLSEFVHWQSLKDEEKDLIAERDELKRGANN